MKTKEQKREDEKGKNAKGITLIALVVTIIVLIILAGVTINMLVGNNGLLIKVKDAKKTWEEATKEEEEELARLQNELNNEINQIETIPIYTAEQLLKMGTGEKVIINGKEYEFGKEKVYVLQNDIAYTGSYDSIAELIKNHIINFHGESHKIEVTTGTGIKEYYTENSKYYIATNKYGYVLRGLELYYDGIDNTGEGLHSSTTTIWKDLSGNDKDATLNHFGNTAISGWNLECLSFDGVNDWVNCGILNMENVTLEATYRLKAETEDYKAVLGNWQTGGNGLTYDSGLYKRRNI